MHSRLFRQLRRYSGISAKKLIIRPRAVGHLQILLGVLLALTFFLSGYGVHILLRSPEEQAVFALQERVEELEGVLRESGSALTSLEMTRGAKRGLEGELRNISADLVVAKDDLAYFLQLVPVGTREGEVLLERLSVRSDHGVAGQYRFSVLVGYHAGRQTAGFSGRLQFLLTVERDGSPVQIVWPDSQEAGARPDFLVQTHQWTRKEGVLTLSPGDTLKKAELLLLQGNVKRAAASVTF